MMERPLAVLDYQALERARNLLTSHVVGLAIVLGSSLDRRDACRCASLILEAEEAHLSTCSENIVCTTLSNAECYSTIRLLCNNVLALLILLELLRITILGSRQIIRSRSYLSKISTQDMEALGTTQLNTNSYRTSLYCLELINATCRLSIRHQLTVVLATNVSTEISISPVIGSLTISESCTSILHISKSDVLY